MSGDIGHNATTLSANDICWLPSPYLSYKMLSFIESRVAATPLAHLYSYVPHSLVNLTAVVTAFITLLGLAAAVSQKVRDVLVFSYTCFLQPLGKTANQAERLDKFYQHQATGEYAHPFIEAAERMLTDE